MVSVLGAGRGDLGWAAIVVVLVPALLLRPAPAQANKLKVTSYELEPNAGVISLEADAPLDEPWMKVSGSTVRVWFPKIDKLSRFEQGDTEQAIRAVRLRPGTGDTAQLNVELSADHKLTSDDVELSRSGTHATVRIALPSLEPPASAAKAAAASATLTAAASAIAPNAAVPASADPAASAASGSATANAVPQYKSGVATEPAGKPALKPAQAEPKLIENGKGLSTMQWLMLLTVALAAIYGALRIGQRAAGAAHPSITVLGSKRLGPRHQLLIVRALGQDHLLSVHGGRTERIMSTDSPSSPAAPAHASDPNDGVDPLGSGMAATLRSLRSQEMFKQNATQRPRRASHGADDGDTFGAELLDFVRGQGRPASAAAEPAQKPRLTESEAVAGLVRLRKNSG